MKSPRVRFDPRSFLAGFSVVILLLLGAGFVVSQASGPQSVGHSMDNVWCDDPLGCIISSWIVKDAVITSKLADASVTTPKVADNSISRQKLQADSVDSSKVVNNSVKAVDVDSAEIQRRVSQNCVSAGGTIQSINADGTVVCIPGPIFNTYTGSANQSFTGSGITLSATVQCGAGTLIFCDGDVATTTAVEILESITEFVGPSLTPQCKTTVVVSNGSGFESVTVKARALCKS